VKYCIVKSSLITKHNRLDAGYYLGTDDGKLLDEAVKRDRARFHNAIRRLQQTLRRQRAHEERLRRLVAAGEITPLGGETDEQEKRDRIGGLQSHRP